MAGENFRGQMGNLSTRLKARIVAMAKHPNAKSKLSRFGRHIKDFFLLSANTCTSGICRGYVCLPYKMIGNETGTKLLPQYCTVIPELCEHFETTIYNTCMTF